MFLCFNYKATPQIYTYLHPLSLHDALPISDDTKNISFSSLPRSTASGCVTLSAGSSEVITTPSVVYLAMSPGDAGMTVIRSEEHTSELQSLMRISYAVFCLTKKKKYHKKQLTTDMHNTNHDNKRDNK